MLYFMTNGGTIYGTVLKVVDDNANKADCVCCWEFKTFVEAQMVADGANALNDGNVYVATDSGPCVSPRFDVIAAPKAGDLVSYAFNGDYYPCGKIVSVGSGSKMVVKTDTGAVFYRYKLTGSWVKKGGTWTLVQGHSNEKNPCF